MRAFLRVIGLLVAATSLIVICFLASWPRPATSAQPAPPSDQQQPAFTPGELVTAGQLFFGTISQGLATVIEKAVAQWGLPNGYVLGEEAGPTWPSTARHSRHSGRN